MLDEKLLMELQEYIDRRLSRIVHYTYAAPVCSRRSLCEEPEHDELEDFIRHNRKPTFSQVLFGFIDGKSASDSDIYKRAGIDRRHFSKIRSNPCYKPGKNTAIALALALELDKKETDELLSAAGYSLSESDTFDLVIQFCVEKKLYDIQSVNLALDYFSLKPLIGAME